MLMDLQRTTRAAFPRCPISGLRPARLKIRSTMTAVGKAAFGIVEEIRRQFREIKGLMEGKADPDSATCVDIATRAALHYMIAPGLFGGLSPAAGRFIIR